MVTKAELRAGILAAADIESRDRRLRTFELAGRIAAFPVDERVADSWAQMRAYLAASGRRVNVNDAWIAATAVAHRLPLITQDADFEPLAGVAGLTVVEI